MADDEDEDYFFFGTPLPEPEDLKPRQRQAAEKAGQLKTLPVWKQEVTDEQGRKRFHGAFTGGFSAGFYNTVGSKEGWAPAQFVSSRNQRAEKKAQAAEDYMDEDEKEALRSQALAASADFDTFGGTATDLARRQAESETPNRSSAIPGPIPDELIVPSAESMGVKLLKKMGWRPGKGVGPKHEVAAAEKRREARRAMIALAQSYGAEVPPGLDEEPAEPPEEESDAAEVPKTTPIFVLQPKKDFYGLGFDPLKGAPEFRAAKRAKTEGSKGVGKGGNLFRPQAGKVGAGFGVGALEEVGEEDEDVYATELPMDQELLDEDEQEKQAEGKAKASEKDLSAKLGFKPGPRDTLPGFRLGSGEGVEVQEWFAPPVVPKGFVPRHVFVSEGLGSRGVAKAKEVAPPDDEELQKRIETLAAFVANSGEKLEEIARERNKGSPEFGFLFGGPGKEYYAWKKSELIRERGLKLPEGSSKVEEPGPVDRGGFRKPAEFAGKSGRDKASRMTAEERGRLLGEAPLPRSEDAKSVSGTDQKAGSNGEALSGPKSVMDMIAPEDRARLQGALASTFTKGAAQDMGYDNRETVKPFAADPAKQARYETFLQERSVGGLRRPGRNDGLTEEERLREKEEFETTAQLANQGLKPAPSPPPPVHPALAFLGDRFAPAGDTPETSRGSIMDIVAAMQSSAAAAVAKKFPRREVEEWRPAPLLCRRFNILDPYEGKAAAPAKPKSKTDSLALLMPQFGQDINPELAPGGSERLALPPPPKLQAGETAEIYVPEKEPDVEFEAEPLVSGIDKPIDLFKAIFSDSEDEEEAPGGLEVLGRPGEKAAEAATAALNRHAASEFLAQFGVELPVPPVVAQPERKAPVLFRPKKERNNAEGAELNRGSEAGVKMRVTGLLSFEEEVGEGQQPVEVTGGVKEGVKKAKKEEAGNKSNDGGLDAISEDAKGAAKMAAEPGVAERNGTVQSGNGTRGGVEAGLREEDEKRGGIAAQEEAHGGVDLWAETFEGKESEDATRSGRQTERNDTQEPGLGQEAVVQKTAEQSEEQMRPVMGPLPPDRRREGERKDGLETGGSGRWRRNERNGKESEDESSEDERRRKRREKKRERREGGSRRKRHRSENVGPESGSDESEAERKRRRRKRREERRRRERSGSDWKGDGQRESDEDNGKVRRHRKSREEATGEGNFGEQEMDRKLKRHRKEQRRDQSRKGRQRRSYSGSADDTDRNDEKDRGGGGEKG
ncbi:hypothetical protein KFL_000060440 [Klebsormidium nitens]|uniref:G-patch domain-containing protein n=1 Tax=Klebsormidium nitens TaxID=105231 RepID=A0A0U9HQK1_KLENI|nr:hypothetical protein KFL_000060440 [Klebsormidium nitens]|eukprot:GAQ77979.1 hypothetical protein KFL_000060440 [Klebsormidium nitens]